MCMCIYICVSTCPCLYAMGERVRVRTVTQVWEHKAGDSKIQRGEPWGCEKNVTERVAGSDLRVLLILQNLLSCPTITWTSACVSNLDLDGLISCLSSQPHCAVQEKYAIELSPESMGEWSAFVDGRQSKQIPKSTDISANFDRKSIETTSLFQILPLGSLSVSLPDELDTHHHPRWAAELLDVFLIEAVVQVANHHLIIRWRGKTRRIEITPCANLND